MERITDTHIYFWGSELSNWHRCNFTHKGISFDSSEQAFMWEKAMYFGDIETANKILKESNPRLCKSLGREVKNFDKIEWLKVSFSIMINVNYSKWSSDEKLKDLLLSTDPKILVEASPKDNIWGIGLHWNDDLVLDEKNWKGYNLLGSALMEVRKKLKNK